MSVKDGNPFWITHNFNQRTLQGQESSQVHEPIEIFEPFEHEATAPRHLWTLGGSSGGLNRGRGFASTSSWFHRDMGNSFAAGEDLATDSRRNHLFNDAAAPQQRTPSSKYKRPMVSDNAVVQ